MEDLVTRWQGKRVLITGHTGFKGSWLSLWLARLGATIRGYALDPITSPNMTFAGISLIIRGLRTPSRSSHPKWYFTWRPNLLCVVPTPTRLEPMRQT
jgi:hypothetical protein